MRVRVAISGFGRAGRATSRAAFERRADVGLVESAHRVLVPVRPTV
jgi:glyceraldehyde-3-phosphate dehydrogenase/erythrose-4-phosphate dehydrogenase